MWWTGYHRRVIYKQHAYLLEVRIVDVSLLLLGLKCPDNTPRRPYYGRGVDRVLSTSYFLSRKRGRVHGEGGRLEVPPKRERRLVVNREGIGKGLVNPESVVSNVFG